MRAHLERWLPAERAASISDDSIRANFCFDASREVRLVSAPDDSVFVFPENTQTSASISASSATVVDSSANVCPVSSSPLSQIQPSTVQECPGSLTETTSISMPLANLTSTATTIATPVDDNTTIVGRKRLGQFLLLFGFTNAELSVFLNTLLELITS